MEVKKNEDWVHTSQHTGAEHGSSGSADGAAVLKAMNRIFKLRLSLDELAQIGKEVGADIPFCVYEKTAYVAGIGEKIDIIENEFNTYILLVKPKKGVSTQKCFKMLDLSKAHHPNIKEMRNAIENNNYSDVVSNLGNTLEKPSLELVPVIDKIKKQLLELGFDGALMSGSGSCVFALTQDKEILERGYDYFENTTFFVRKTEIFKK